MAFVLTQKIMFKHCDPAGIVFFPRYFEMINDCAEGFFETVVEMPFSTLHRSGGVPSLRIEADFSAPSRLGETIDITLRVTALGGSSLTLSYSAIGHDGLRRFGATQVMVHVGADLRPAPWPDAARTILESELEVV